MRHVHGRDVYDDQSDQWFRFDNEEQAIGFASQAEMRLDPTVREAVATRYNVHTYTIAPNEIVELVGPDASRVKTIVYLALMNNTDQAILYIGDRMSIQSGQGYGIAYPNVDLKMTTTDSVWATLTEPGTTSANEYAIVSVYTESQVS